MNGKIQTKLLNELIDDFEAFFDNQELLLDGKIKEVVKDYQKKAWEESVHNAVRKMTSHNSG